MKAWLGVVVVLGWSAKVWGQQAFSLESWHRGNVTLNDGRTIEGSLMYNFDKNSLLVKTPEGKTFSFSAMGVTAFEITDAIKGKQRQFYAIPYQTDEQYKRPIFFELLLESDIALLSRETIVEEQVPIGAIYGIGMGMAIPYTPMNYRLVKREVFSYYMLDKDNKITLLEHNDAKKLAAQFGEKRSQIASFIESNKLNLKNPEDMIRLFVYVNGIVSR